MRSEKISPADERVSEGGVFNSATLYLQDSLSDFLIIFFEAVRVRKAAEACAIGNLNTSGDLKPTI